MPRRFLTMAEALNTDLDAHKRELGRERHEAAHGRRGVTVEQLLAITSGRMGIAVIVLTADDHKRVQIEAAMRQQGCESVNGAPIVRCPSTDLSFFVTLDRTVHLL
jgi:hypothetical protein